MDIGPAMQQIIQTAAAQAIDPRLRALIGIEAVLLFDA
jgi:hypothetical protein